MAAFLNAHDLELFASKESLGLQLIRFDILETNL
jgi:hypothetical protein